MSTMEKTSIPLQDSLLEVSIPRDGAKNVICLAAGFVNDEETYHLIGPQDVRNSPAGLRLDQIQFLVQTGLLLKLWWGNGKFIAPIEGRGKADYYWLDSLHHPENSEIYMTVKGSGSLQIILDLSKTGV